MAGDFEGAQRLGDAAKAMRKHGRQLKGYATERGRGKRGFRCGFTQGWGKGAPSLLVQILRGGLVEQLLADGDKGVRPCWG